MKRHFLNIFRLGVKELQILWHDKVMVILIAWSFSFAIYVGATSVSMELHHAPIAFVDQDRSALSMRLSDAFYPPHFKMMGVIEQDEIDQGMDSGKFTFVVVIPSGFEKDIINGIIPDLQLNIDATRMTQAGIGAGYIQQIITSEIVNFNQSFTAGEALPIHLITRMKYNPNLDSIWFGGLMEIINNIAMLSIMLAGAALIREREHGTLEHLLVLPVSATEIMLGKVWSMGLVVLVAVIFSLFVVVKGILGIPLAGSIPLFLLGSTLILFANTSMGIFMGTIARTMPQFGLIFIMTILPIMILSGAVTPFESMPEILQYLMHLVPTSHFVSMSQAILYRGAGFDIVWMDMFWILLIGILFFLFSLSMFKKSLN
jgi:ABC-2 type transport system permease protein